MSQTSRNTNRNIRFIYDLPIEHRSKLCDYLDIRRDWEELGGRYMHYDIYTLHKVGNAVYRDRSPTEDLLQLWGSQNNTIFELFIMLKKMKHYQAMKVLQPFVDEKYHHLIYEGHSGIENERYEDKLKTVLEFSGSSRINTDNSVEKIGERQIQEGNLQPQVSERNQSNIVENKTDPSDFNELGSLIPYISYKELELATNGWDKSRILGRGGFGVVFQGIWKQTAIAIKRLEPQKGNEIEFNALEAQRQQSFRELKFLNSCRHDNILPVYGFSQGENKYCLVYQYMSRGSLEDRIQCRHGSKPLNWLIRYNIVTGTARGLQFLHDMDKPLIHGDIKSANILLDQHFEPKIGDFGLAREGPASNSTHVKVSRVHGTRPYLPDEFLRQKKFSSKVDTYSFGVVLFEIATGLRAYDENRRPDQFLRDFILNYDEEKIHDLVDPKIGPENFNLFKSFIDLGKRCVAYRARERPEMKNVSKQLDVVLGDREQLIRSLTQWRLVGSSSFINRRPSLVPPTGSYHPEQWMFATPPGSFQPMSNRLSPSPTNPPATQQGLKQVSEESSKEDVSATSNSVLKKTAIVEASQPNVQGIPGIKLIPPQSSCTTAKSSDTVESESKYSSNDSNSSRSCTDQSDELDQNLIQTDENTEASSNDFLPNITALQV